jgi:hypothetical protein
MTMYNLIYVNKNNILKMFPLKANPHTNELKTFLVKFIGTHKLSGFPPS